MNNDAKVKELENTIVNLLADRDKLEQVIKDLQAEHRKETLNLKRTIEELTNENKALKAMNHEMNELVKKQEVGMKNLLESNKAIIGGVMMVVSMLGRTVNSNETD